MACITLMAGTMSAVTRAPEKVTEKSVVVIDAPSTINFELTCTDFVSFKNVVVEYNYISTESNAIAVTADVALNAVAIVETSYFSTKKHRLCYHKLLQNRFNAHLYRDFTRITARKKLLSVLLAPPRKTT